MPTTTASPRTATYVRPALLTGLALTVLATVAPLIDLLTVDTIGDHVRAAYPDWSADLVTKDRNAITIYLVAVGVLGLAGWLWSLIALARNNRRLRAIATTLLILGATIQLTTLSVGGEAYKTIVPTLHGTLGVLPSLAGLVAVVGLWRRR
jgi:hypothetical protein